MRLHEETFLPGESFYHLRLKNFYILVYFFKHLFYRA